MDKTISTLKNVNFWGLLICNLVVANRLWALVSNSDIQFQILFGIVYCVFVAFIHLFLFKKLNFPERTNLELLFCSFFFYFVISVPILLISCIAFSKVNDIYGMIGCMIAGVFWVGIRFSLYITAMSFFWLLREKSKNDETSTLNNFNFGGALICYLVLFYVLRDGGLFEINLYSAIASVLAVFVFLFVFRKIKFEKHTIWKLALYSVLVSVFLVFFIGFIRGLAIPDFRTLNESNALFNALFFGVTYIFSGIRTFFILLASITTFIWFYKEKCDRLKKNPPEIVIETEEEKRLRKKERKKKVIKRLKWIFIPIGVLIFLFVVYVAGMRAYGNLEKNRIEKRLNGIENVEVVKIWKQRFGLVGFDIRARLRVGDEGEIVLFDLNSERMLNVVEIGGYSFVKLFCYGITPAVAVGLVFEHLNLNTIEDVLENYDLLLSAVEDLKMYPEINHFQLERFEAYLFVREGKNINQGDCFFTSEEFQNKIEFARTLEWSREDSFWRRTSEK